MLTRDIPLEKAILDLIDNSIDSALKLRASSLDRKFKIELTVNRDEFIISDNCGGISLENANKYAFKFGKPEGSDLQNGSVGRFGIGMKRALFKLGKKFTIESKCKSDHFMVLVDVEEWMSDEKSWNFEYFACGSNPEIEFDLKDDDGVIIKVKELHKDISYFFTDNSFHSLLEFEISRSVSYRLFNRIEILFNDKAIKASPLSLCAGGGITPFYVKQTEEISDGDKISFEIFASIGRPNPTDAGWYIFCNERLVLAADKSKITGWKESKDDDDEVIKFHNQYAMFRGIVFFTADNPERLPMTTTKMGLDVNHLIYLKSLRFMKEGLTQVVNFLKLIKNKETKTSILDLTEIKEISELRSSEKGNISFKGPEISDVLSNRLVSISYSKKRELVERVKDYMGVSTNIEVGEGTFEFYLEMNGLKDGR